MKKSSKSNWKRSILSPYVQQYWSMDASIGYGESCIQRIVPGGLSGQTPREFFSNCESTSDYFAEIGSQNSNR